MPVSYLRVALIIVRSLFRNPTVRRLSMELGKAAATHAANLAYKALRRSMRTDKNFSD